jgi:hypothetical protein
MRRAEAAAILNFRAVLHGIIHIDRAFSDGNEAGARDALALIRREITPEYLANLEVIAAQAEATEAGHRTQSTLAAIFAGRAEPNPHASNDHLPAPSEPAPSIA